MAFHPARTDCPCWVLRLDFYSHSTLAALAQPAKATEALRHAVALKPDLGDGWRVLRDLLFRSGDESAALAGYSICPKT